MKKSLSWLLLLLICIQSFSMVFMINNSLKMEDELRLHLQANNLTIVTILVSFGFFCVHNQDLGLN